MLVQFLYLVERGVGNPISFQIFKAIKEIKATTRQTRPHNNTKTQPLYTLMCQVVTVRPNNLIFLLRHTEKHAEYSSVMWPALYNSYLR